MREDMGEHTGRVQRDASNAFFFLRPLHDAFAESIGSHELGHELNLIEANPQEEDGEFGKPLFAQVAPSVEIVTSLQIACGKVTLVLALMSRQTASN